MIDDEFDPNYVGGFLVLTNKYFLRSKFTEILRAIPTIVYNIGIGFLAY